MPLLRSDVLRSASRRLRKRPPGLTFPLTKVNSSLDFIVTVHVAGSSYYLLTGSSARVINSSLQTNLAGRQAAG